MIGSVLTHYTESQCCQVGNVLGRGPEPHHSLDVSSRKEELFKPQ